MSDFKEDFKENIERLFENTISENKIIRIVEERGMFMNYKHVIEPIISYVQNFIQNNPPTKQATLSQKYTIDKFEKIVIPKELTDKLTWIDNLNIFVNVYDVTSEVFEKVPSIDSHRDASGDLNRKDSLNDKGQLNSFNIYLTTFSVDRQIYKQNIQSSLYHEITHAFENYNRLKKYGSNSFDYISKTKYVKVANNVDDPFSYLNYMLTQTEINADIASVYGDLERMNSVRGNFAKNIKKTDAYRNYIKAKTITLPNLIKQGEVSWAQYQKETYFVKSKQMSPNEFKKSFVKYADMKLNDLFTGIGKVASQYYDDIEMKDNYNPDNDTIKVK